MDHSPKARPPLLNLDTVCIVAREGSFSAAADLLNMTHGAISRRVQAVENWLGISLFERHGRGVRLTPDGQRLVTRLDQAFGIIDDAAEQWHPGRGAKRVKVSVLPSFAKLWLFDRLAALETGPPDSRIQLEIEPHNADISGGEVDLSIRYGRGTWPDVDSEVFLPEMLYPVASRNIANALEGAGSEAMLRHPLLHDSDLTGWRAWFDGWLKRGKPVRLFEVAVPSPLAYYFVTAKRESRPEVLALIGKMTEMAQPTLP